MVTIPDGLPPWAQGLATIIVLIGFGASIWKGVIKRGESPPSNAPNAMIAMDIVSTKPFQDMATELRGVNDRLDRLLDAEQAGTDALYRVAAAERATETAIRDLCGVIERKL